MAKKNWILPRIFSLALLLAIAGCQAACTNRANTARQTSADFNSLVTQPAQTTINALEKYSSSAAIINSLRFRLYTTDEQLSGNSVTCLLQDDLGFLWIGTTEGLNRFDGYSFVVYRNDPARQDSLSSSHITALWLDNDGVLWVGTERGLNRFDREQNRFQRLQHNPSDPQSLANDTIRVLYQDSEGMLWVGTQGGGLDEIDPKTLAITHHTFLVGVNGSISSNWINDILEDPSGRLWIATENGLNLFDRDTRQFEAINRTIINSVRSVSERTRTITVDAGGLLWIGLADGGVERMEPVSRLSQAFYQKNVPLSLSDDRVNDIYADSKGRIWAATQSGIDMYDAAGNAFRPVIGVNGKAQEAPALDAYGFTQIMEDEHGLIWAGNISGGLLSAAINAERFVWLTSDEDTVSAPHGNNVIAAARDNEGVLWIAYPDGIDRYSPLAERFAFFPIEAITGGAGTVLTSLFMDAANNIMAGSDKGFYIFERNENTWIQYTAAIEESGSRVYSIAEMPITAFAQLRPLEYWITTRGSGLIRLDVSGGRFSIFRYERGNVSSLSADFLTCILADDANILWVGTNASGLNRFNTLTGGSVHYIHNPANQQSLSDNAITAILKDSQGRIWIGTAAGLNLLEDESGVFKHYGNEQGLEGESIRALVEDADGAIWVSTDKGISRLELRSGTVSNFSFQDGLQNGKFNTGAALRLQDGSLFFGGTQGINIFNSLAASPVISSPQIRITKLTQNGIPILATLAEPTVKQITLQWPRNYFDFEAAGLSFNQPEKNQYAYMLERFDQDWNWAGTRRFGGYTNLPGGDYTLRVIGSNKDGVWNKEGATLLVRVIPAPWENNWLRLAAVLIAALVVYSAVRMRIDAISRYNRQLADEVEERTRDIEKRRRAAEGLREILVRLNSEQPLKESLEFITGQAAGLFGAKRAIIVEFRSRKRMHLAAIHPEVPVDFQLPVPVQEWLSKLLKINAGQAVCEKIPPDITHILKAAGNCLEGAVVLCAAPVHSAGEAYGGLLICDDKERVMTEEDFALLQTLADQVALAVESARLRAEARELAVVSERSRIARDLHDAVTQTLFSASLTADSIPSAWLRDRAEGVELLNNLRALNRSALAEMRTLLLELRPTAITRTGLKDLLEQLANAFSGKADVKIKINAEENFTLPENVHMAFYRIAQEALTNAVKHSRACQISINLHGEPLGSQHTNKNKIELEICDDGCGFDPAAIDSGRFGLVDMQERAQQIGAQLSVQSTQGKGTCIRIEWIGRAVQ